MPSSSSEMKTWWQRKNQVKKKGFYGSIEEREAGSLTGYGGLVLGREVSLLWLA